MKRDFERRCKHCGWLAMSGTALEIILRNCEKFADKTALHWLNKECEVIRKISYRELERSTRELATRLLRDYCGKKRQRVVLCYPPGLDFIEVFVACLRAGVIAVPVSPPDPHQSVYTTETLIRIVCDSGAHCVLTNDHFIQETDHQQLENLKQRSLVPWYSTTTASNSGTHGHEEKEGKDLYSDSCAKDTDTKWLDNPLPEDIPLLQYTSGSTSFPKGVMSTHANLLHNLKLMEAIMKTNKLMVEVSFLPHFHDMGLICSYLQPLYSGGTGYFMSPVTFVENPGIWIEAFSRYKGTHSKAPNFAFELVLRKGFPKNIDLGSVRYITNGSEPVYIETITRFESTFAPYGLKKNSIHVGYGLAEHTVFLCGTQEEDPVIVNGRINCGRPIMGVTVKIVDPETHTEVPEGVEAEIWVHSESKSVGYWEKEDQTQVTFEKQLANDPRAFLGTGDLGFIKEGQLFVSGRQKDLIVIHGRNIHPSDVELRIESQVDVIRAGRSAAFEYEYVCTDVEDAIPTRGIGFVAEIRFPEKHTSSDLHLLAEQVVAAITLDFQVEVLVVAFIRPRTMPRTTSGKRQRQLCKKQFTAGLLSELYRWSKFKMTTPSDVRQHNSNVPTPISPSTLEPEPEECRDNVSSSSSVPDVAAMQKKITKVAPPVATKKRASDSKPAERRNSLDTLTATVSMILGVKLHPHSNIWAHGCDSVKAVQISQMLQSEFGFAVEPHLLFTHQTPNALMEKLQRRLLNVQSPKEREKDESWKKGHGLQPLPPPKLQLTHQLKENPHTALSSRHRSDDIAIVGMACSFAGCDSPAALWELMINKKVATTSVYDSVTGQVIHGGFAEATSNFDYNWFRISEWEASTMDPQQCLLLHRAWECFQNAGYGSRKSLDEIKGSDIGVFVGVSSSDARVLGQSRKPPPPGTSLVSSIAANRISHSFGLTGPSMAIDTACAASLSALHAACTSLRLQECSACLVGGVNVLLDPNCTMALANMGMLSQDGKCRVFDSNANGYVRGEGCGMVLLMPILRARKEGKRILAVIKSTATNHNGASATLTSPSNLAQRNLFQKSLESAEIQPNDLAYLEAHGTGTTLGDPIEVEAIQEVFASQDAEEAERRRSTPLVVGSIKANIGHLETGAGIAGLIKTVLVLEHAKAPGNACLQTLNPALCYDHSQITIPHDNISLESCYHGDRDLLCAGVSSFGFGGTNVSAILQQYSQLPHMAGVECSVLFAPTSQLHTMGGKAEAVKLLSLTITSLCSAFVPFERAYQSCQDAITRALNGFANTATKKSSLESLDWSNISQQPEVLAFLLFYSIVVTLREQRVKISQIGGLDLCGELVALAFSTVLGLSDVVRLLLNGVAPDRCSIYALPTAGNITESPNVPIFSHILGKVCGPQTSELDNDYLLRLVSNLREGKFQTSETDGTSLVSSSIQPRLWISLSPPNTFTPVLNRANTVFITLEESSHSPVGYFREKILELRSLNDKLALESCESKPSRDMKRPAFYEHYPFRALVDSIQQQFIETKYGSDVIGDTKCLSRKKLSIETELKESLKDHAVGIEREESGYVTQTTSTELVEVLSPTQDHKTKCPKTEEIVKQKIISDLFSLVKKDLENPEMPVGEVAMTGFFALGLDSLNLMEIREYMIKNFDVCQSYSELLELETIGAMVEAAMETNPSLLLQLSGDQEEEPISPTDTQVNDSTSPEKMGVLQALFKLVEKEIEPSDVSVEMFARSGIFQLGLDSLNIMQIADFLRQTYQVDKKFSELIECETIAEISEMVIKESPVLVANEAAAGEPVSEEISRAVSLEDISNSLNKTAAAESVSNYPVLTKEGYYTVPSTAEIHKLSLDDLKSVRNFTVGHKGVGKVIFLGESDVSGLDLDQLVRIEPQFVELCTSTVNDPKGKNLNKPSLVFFENVHPLEKTKCGYDVLDRALKQLCESLEVPAQFVNYDRESGELVMKIDHFY